MVKLKWFGDCASAEDIKKLYRELCKQYHPDLHGAETEAIMKEINAEYDIAFENLNAGVKTAAEVRAIINKLVTCQGLILSIVGTWLWAEGNTYQHKEVLKSFGFKFSPKKKAWYWHESSDYGRPSGMSLDQIKNKYGCETVTSSAKVPVFAR